MDFLEVSELLVGIALFISSIILTYRLYVFKRGSDKGELVTHGIYSKIRNPEHLPFLMFFFSFFLVRRSAINFILSICVVIVSHISIKKEESKSIEIHGDKYRGYMKEVPWRLIPRLY